MPTTSTERNRAHRARQTARVEKMRVALTLASVQLEKAADQFAFYADEHAKKKTVDGDAKAGTNHQWALACAKIDHIARDALSVNGVG